MDHRAEGTPPATLASALAYLGTFTDWEQRLPDASTRRTFDLGRVRRLLSELGDPHLGRPSIHVAGTKGKGSTVHFADAVLRAHGVRTFRFLSPHLEKLNERIAIGGADLTDGELARAVFAVRPAIERLRTASSDDDPTFFEVMTAAGFTAAREHGAAADVVEVGLGGRLDATNVIDPAVSVITSIDLDHTKILGSTREQIASEKAGIIKPSRPVLAGLEVRDPACAVIVARARALGSPVSHVGRGITVAPAGVALSPKGQPGARFSGVVEGLAVERGLAPGGGPHQATNALLAIGACARVLAALGVPLRIAAALDAIASAELPGRAELFGKDVQVLLDGAHTGRSCAALVDLARPLFRGRRVVLLGGLTRERSVRALFSPFLELVRHAVFAPLPTPRSADPQEAAAEWASLGGTGEAAADPASALDAATSRAGRGGAVVVAGSFYLAGALRPVLRNLV